MAGATFALALANVVVTIVVAARGTPHPPSMWADVPFVVAILAPASVGLFVALRRPGNRVAWILLEAVADGLRIELRPWGVRVVLIEPGSIDTDIWRGADERFSAMVAAMSDEHRRLYDGLLAGSRKLIRATARRAAAVENVVKAVEQAVTAPRPRTRYVVGADACGQILLRTLLPDRAFDAMVARMTGARQQT